jgi:hypothetical protein
VPDDFSIDHQFERLQDALHQNDQKAILDALWPFSAALNDSEIADDVVERLLAILTKQEMYLSPYAGHLLQFCEVESEHLTDRQKWFCIRFLNAHGDQFTDGFSSQMVGELRAGLFLRMKKPTPQQWDDYQKMQRDAQNITGKTPLDLLPGQ